MSAYTREISLPGLVDVHVHARDFAQEYKEDFESASRAAAAGGVALMACMPNYEPALEVRPYDELRMSRVHDAARGRLWIDAGMWAASQPEYDNVAEIAALAPLSVGVKFYMEPTQGNDTQFDPNDFRTIATEWHARTPRPIAAHVEEDTIDDAIGMIGQDLGHTLYIPHTGNRYMLDAIIKAKKKGLDVRCGVTPHQLFMTAEDSTDWFKRMKPVLGSQEDQNYLWHNLAYIDIIETDHAPHTKAEKEEANQLNPEGSLAPEARKCFGVPGLETMLPLLLHEALSDNPRLQIDQLVAMTSTNPRALLGLPRRPNSAVKVNPVSYEVRGEDLETKCGWSPFEGRTVTGVVSELAIRGQVVYTGGRFIGQPTGRIMHDVAA